MYLPLYPLWLGLCKTIEIWIDSLFLECKTSLLNKRKNYFENRERRNDSFYFFLIWFNNYYIINPFFFFCFCRYFPPKMLNSWPIMSWSWSKWSTILVGWSMMLQKSGNRRWNVLRYVCPPPPLHSQSPPYDVIHLTFFNR